MASWLWLLIWLGLGLIAFAVWAVLLVRMVRPAARLQADLEKLNFVSAQLKAEVRKRPPAEHPEDNLGDDPERLNAERLVIQAKRRKRKERRARRLVSRVKDIKLEGRFKDV